VVYYELEGEQWVAAHTVKELYGINLEELTNLVNKGKVRTRQFRNFHNDKIFKGYSIYDLDNLPKEKKLEDLCFE